METGRYGNRGEEEGELRARVPGIDVRNTPALLRERQETSHPPKTLPSKAIPPGPLGSGRTACCLEEERFARMQYKPRIYHFVRLSGCVPSKTLDTPPTHDRPLECTTSNPLPFAEREDTFETSRPSHFHSTIRSRHFAGPCQHFLTARVRMTSSIAHQVAPCAHVCVCSHACHYR